MCRALLEGFDRAEGLTFPAEEEALGRCVAGRGLEAVWGLEAAALGW